MLAPRTRLAPALAVIGSLLGAGTDVAQASGAGEVKWDVISDINGDGVRDRAMLVNAADGRTDLHIFLSSGNTEPRDDARPDIIKKAIAPGTILAFESREKGTLSVTSCTGCTSITALYETLRVVYRDGMLMVGGFTRGWELTKRLKGGQVDVLMGSCSIDFLTGEGRVSKDLGDAVLVEERFKPIALADWSAETRPAICRYKGEK